MSKRLTITDPDKLRRAVSEAQKVVTRIDLALSDERMESARNMLKDLSDHLFDASIVITDGQSDTV